MEGRVEVTDSGTSGSDISFAGHLTKSNTVERLDQRLEFTSFDWF